MAVALTVEGVDLDHALGDENVALKPQTIVINLQLTKMNYYLADPVAQQCHVILLLIPHHL